MNQLFQTFVLFKGALSRVRQFLATEGSLKVMKNAFFFTLKAQIFVMTFWSDRKTV